MLKAQLMGVKHESCGVWRATIQAVSHQGAPHMRQVHTDLVLAPSYELGFYQRALPKALCDAHARHSLLACATHAHTLRIVTVARYGCVYGQPTV
jgi:hypothetical protein